MTVFVQAYPEGTELCPTCWQPDNCGDCNHTPLTEEQVHELGGQFIPLDDTICVCNHWYLEHDLPLGGAPSDAFCGAPGCDCPSFQYSPAASTPSAIADRGGDPVMWPDHVKRALDPIIWHDNEGVWRLIGSQTHGPFDTEAEAESFVPGKEDNP